ncbi:MAG: hypothetical protein GF408_02180, partial [Candidatus Omnitrophica bacterium]|nr:hypothetical protein [Candidatus Omnitrophota bacterium]
PEPTVEDTADETEHVSVKEETAEEKTPGPSYNIRVAAFRNRDSALYAVDELKMEGYNAAYRQSGDWYQVFVAGYRTREEAEKDSWQLADRYPDCYIKQVNSDQ